jgi:hypothetical protein
MPATLELIPITQQVLDELNELVPTGVRAIPARNPVVHGVVRRDGGQFVTVTVRLAGSEPKLLDRRALERMARLTRIPTALLAELSDDLILQNVNFQLRRRWSWFTHAVVRDDRILDWMAPGWKDLDLKPSDVAAVCGTTLGDQPCLAAKPDGEWPNLTLLFTTENFSHVFTNSPREKDRHHFFLGVRVDLCGWTVPVVQAVSYRLVCTNGMVALAGHSGSERKLFATERTAFLDKLRRASFEAVGYIRTVLIPGIERTIERKADLEQLIQHLPDRVAQLVRSAYAAEELGSTEYHVVNALTRAANYPDCPAEWRDRLRTLAGELTVGRRCWQCFRPVG